MDAIRNIKAVVFDMDGVIVDSEPFWQQAEKKVFAGMGIDLTQEMLLETMGLRIDEVIVYWSQRFKWSAAVTHKQLIDQLLDAMVQHLTDDAQLMPGFTELVQYFKAQQRPLAIASSSPMRLIETVVQRFNLAQDFQILKSAEFERHGKPHPGVYLTACKALGSNPLTTLAIEDSINGVIAAKAAQMPVIAVPEAKQLGNIKFQIADLVCETLVEAKQKLHSEND